MSFDQTKAFETQNGFIVTDGTGVFSGPDSPVGFDAPVGAIYLRTNNEVWKKYDLGSSSWHLLEASEIYFDNVSAPNFLATNAQAAIVEARGQSGQILPGLFSGNPKKTSVTLALAFPTNNYSTTFESADGRIWIAENLATTGFDVSSQANATLANILYWTAKLNP